MRKLLATLALLLLTLAACDAEPIVDDPVESQEDGLRRWCTHWTACGTTPTGGVLTCCDAYCYQIEWCSPPSSPQCLYCDPLP